MFFRPKPQPSPANRRRAQRFCTAILSTELGSVADVSALGVRVSVPRKPPLVLGARVTVGLDSATDSLTIDARVARIRHTGGGRYELGLEFIDPTPQQQQAVELLGRTGSTRAGPSASQRRDKLIAALKAPDYYATLGVPPSATPDELQQAFRALARKLHPDVNREPDAERRFAQVNEAYHVLGDERARAEYDAVYAARSVA